MLAIRLQRRGRKGQAHFRVIVQDSRFSPKSGRVVANLGPYDPHSKVATLDKEAAEMYLKNGAQPSERVVKIFTAEKIKLPSWVEQPKKQEGKLKNPDKLRKNQPKEEAPTAEDKPAEEVNEDTPEVDSSDESTDEAKTEAPADTETTDEKVEEAEEKPAEDEKSE